jgi:alpha-glucosidase
VLDGSGKASGFLYEDAGDGYGYQKGEYALTTYAASLEGERVVVKVSGRQGSMQVPARDVTVQVLIEGPGGSTRMVSAKGTESAGVSVQP